jgi:hypothetical protein
MNQTGPCRYYEPAWSRALSHIPLLRRLRRVPAGVRPVRPGLRRRRHGRRTRAAAARPDLPSLAMALAEPRD